MPASDRGGFTLVELLISLTIGLVLIVASLNFAIATYRGAEGNKVREEVYRSARFVGLSLDRDVQTAGVGIRSLIDFGTLSTFNDTLMILAVPWEPDLAPAYWIDPPTGTNNPLDPGGTCGALCIDLNKDAGGNYDLAPGDLARLQVNAERRLLLITEVQDMGATFRIKFLGTGTLLHLPAAFSGGLLLDRVMTTVQKLQPMIYFAQDSVLYRGQSFDATGALQSSPMAYDVIGWNARLVFTDMDVAAAADPSDGDGTNDFDDLLGVQISATFAASRADVRVNSGTLFTRQYQWRIMPRNLRYERNR